MAAYHASFCGRCKFSRYSLPSLDLQPSLHLLASLVQVQVQVVEELRASCFESSMEQGERMKPVKRNVLNHLTLLTKETIEQKLKDISVNSPAAPLFLHNT